MTETKKREFLPGKGYRPGNQVAAKKGRAIMEADTACIPSSDLPVRVCCLFRDKQMVYRNEIIGCAG